MEADQDILDRLRVKGTQFHPVAEATGGQWQLDEGSLGFLVSSVNPGDHTLETGCGHSTIVFALRGARHIVVAPNPHEIQRLRDFCAENGVPTDSLSFHEGLSQEVLPALPSGANLDFVLIDGSHAFPIPFLDWFHSASRLKIGGLMMIDDTHIKTGSILDDFLASERTRWKLVFRRPSLVVYEKLEDPVLPPNDWTEQPFCANPSRVKGVDPSRFDTLRRVLRVRTRLTTARKLMGRCAP